MSDKEGQLSKRKPMSDREFEECVRRINKSTIFSFVKEEGLQKFKQCLFDLKNKCGTDTGKIIDNIKNTNGETLMSMVIKDGNVEVFDMLIECGANPCIENSKEIVQNCCGNNKIFMEHFENAESSYMLLHHNTSNKQSQKQNENAGCCYETINFVEYNPPLTKQTEVSTSISSKISSNNNFNEISKDPFLFGTPNIRISGSYRLARLAEVGKRGNEQNKKTPNLYKNNTNSQSVDRRISFSQSITRQSIVPTSKSVVFGNSVNDKNVTTNTNTNTPKLSRIFRDGNSKTNVNTTTNENSNLSISNNVSLNKNNISRTPNLYEKTAKSQPIDRRVNFTKSTADQNSNHSIPTSITPISDEKFKQLNGSKLVNQSQRKFLDELSNANLKMPDANTSKQHKSSSVPRITEKTFNHLNNCSIEERVNRVISIFSK